jgi:transposase
MRGEDIHQDHLYSYVSPEERVPADHPLRPIRQMANTVLERLSAKLEALYSAVGRPSIPPEKLLRALLLQVLYTLRSERLLMEELDYNLLFRWFVGLHMDDPVWDATVYGKNRERLLKGDVAQAFFQEVLNLAGEHQLLSDEHFTVEGTRIEAWASRKSFKKKDGAPTPPPEDPGDPTVNFHGEQRSNETHQSTTDPEALLSRKGLGKEAKLNYLGHVLMENRHGLAVQTELTQATGTAEREAALTMVTAQVPAGGVTLGADKNYDTKGCVATLRDAGVTPHVAQNTGRRGGSAIDGRTTRHPGYALSQRVRKRVEEIFGWLKTVGGMRKTRFRGKARGGWMFTWALAAYNLVRLLNLLREAEG